MGLFTGIENAKVSEKLPYIYGGKGCEYLFEVEALKTLNSRQHGDMTVAEFGVLEASGEGANPPGTSCSNLTKLKLDSALGNIKSMVAAIANEKHENITAAMVDAAFSAANPLKGELVRASAFVTPTKKGTDFTKVNWRAATDADRTKFRPTVGTNVTAPPAKGATTGTRVRA